MQHNEKKSNNVDSHVEGRYGITKVAILNGERLGFRLILFFVTLACLLVSAMVFGQDEEEEKDNRPIVDREPFDRIVLDRANESEVLEVFPIKDTARALNLEIPEKPYDFRQRGTLKFQLLELEEKYWQVPWQNIAEIKLFDELLLEDARERLKNKEFELCFRTLLYLKDVSENGETSEVKELFDDCLLADGVQSYRDKKYDDALAVFEELYFRKPNFQALGGRNGLEIIGECYEKKIEQQVNDREFVKAKTIVQLLRDKYGGRQKDIIDEWTRKIDEEALVVLKEVREIIARGNGYEAHKAVRRLIHVMPDLLEARQMFQKVVSDFPFVYVGASQPGSDLDPTRIDNWDSRRIGRLTHRWMVEFDGLGDEGGDYMFPQGRIYQVDELGVQYKMEMRDGEHPFGVPQLDTYEISNRLLDLADDRTPDYFIPWARLQPRIEIVDDRSVIFTLKYPYVRPEALIQTSIVRSDSERYNVENGKYVTTEKRKDEIEYRLNENYPAIEGNQHPVIIEQNYLGASAADEALIRGEVDIVDRIYPSDLTRLKRHPDIVVKPYGIPTVHILVPNQRNLHMKSVGFRRGLLFAIDRDLMVKEYIANGYDISGFQPISGPFPPGSDTTDQIAYANDPKIKRRINNNQLALVLAEQVEVQEKMRLENEYKKNHPERIKFAEDGSEIITEDGNEENKKVFKVERPVFVLAHPDNEVVENLCKTIQSQWRFVGIESELRKLPPGVTIPEDDDYDLLFMEIFMQEPMVDAYQLFGENGVVKEVDPTIKQALWMLDEADSWSDVAKSLRRVHQQCFNNMTILPLWQIMDHYAYRDHLSNVGDDLVYLYQDVERWRIDPEVPVEEE